jgi:CRISPR/Cas system CSM-associated protein Csm2 small subunit
MRYNVNDIQKILDFTSWNDKKKIDTLLEIDATLYCNMGLETTKTQRQETKRGSRRIYNAIKQIDSVMGQELLHFMD